MIKSVAGIVYFNKKYLIQIRDQKSTIWFSSFEGLFGGLTEYKEKPSIAIRREINEELNVKVSKCKLLIKFNFKSKKFKNRNRYYYILNLEKKFKNKIILQEGAGYKFVSINKLNLKKMIPWDIAAIYYHQLIINKIQFKPKKLF